MQKLIVVSIDAMIYEDLAFVKQMPNIYALMEKSALVKRVRSIYPTLTYPCHATMRTGCWPSRHGVVNNTAMIPGCLDPKWQWYHDILRCGDLFDACKAAGLTTASVGWPSTGKHPSIDYLVDEVAGLKVKTYEAFHGYYTDSGTPEDLYQAVIAPNIHLRAAGEDDVRAFNTAAACDIIRKYKPDLLMLHLGDPDHARHVHGVYGREVYDALKNMDAKVGDICSAVREAGIWECTNIVLTADHGQLDTTRVIKPNVLLAEAGFIRTGENGEFLDWDAWCQEVGMSALVYLKDPQDRKLRDAVKALFEETIQNGDCGISGVRTAEEAAVDGLAEAFSLVLDTDGHTAFKVDWTGDYMVFHADGVLKGSHGFHPDFGPRPFLMGFGPAFRPGAVLEHADLIDGAPTYAAVLGCALPDAQGKALKDLLI